MQTQLVQTSERFTPPFVVPRSTEARRVEKKAAAAEPSRFAHLVSTSPMMGRLFDVLRRLAPTDLTLTFIGETGTGKDVMANAVHATSRRAGGPFVVFDCGAVPTNLAESELFGHERGAFTGAVTSHAGAFERAHGGTLFLDEIGELPLELQPRLLRALESRRVRRVGGTQDRAVDVRVVAATNRDLPAEVASGRFRRDLFFRLAGAVLPLPPLRHRVEDVPVLVSRLLSDLGRPELRVTPEALALLGRQPWPGNVRELKNVLSRAVALLDGPVLDVGHLRLPPVCSDPGVGQLRLGGLSLEAIERAAIKQALVRSRGNKAAAARTLGIAVSTLYERMKRYGLSGS
jgi:two-component system response regulator FlrC